MVRSSFNLFYRVFGIDQTVTILMFRGIFHGKWKIHHNIWKKRKTDLHTRHTSKSCRYYRYLDENALLQTLHLVLSDTDGGFIATSPLYLVEETLDRQDLPLPPLFLIPTPDNLERYNRWYHK